MTTYRPLDLILDIALLLGALGWLLSSEDVQPFRIGEATYEDCGGGVLPDQVDVPDPEPMQ